MPEPPEDDEPIAPPSMAPTLARESDAAAPTIAAEGPPVGQTTMVPTHGERFADRYVFAHVLGKGGMGEVRLCADDRLGRDVAVKTMYSTASRGRFLREAKLQGRLEHPSVVPVYDVGEVVGTPYFTMRRIVGITLADVVARLQDGDAEFAAKYTRRRLLTDFLQACQAVAYAHDHGVVHRDLKPANIMLGEYGEVYVLDWGIAKVRDGWNETGEPRSVVPSDGSHTSDGSVLGTLGYMPPEQLEGASDKLDFRADIYALGSILFELLTLQRLHPATTSGEKIASTLAGADARASVRAPEREVPPELEAICVHATRQIPADRHSDVRALIEDVERFLDGDRDLERRRQLAREHAELAARLLRGEDELAARAESVREAVRALAFDPDNVEALRILGRLLVEPPTRTPVEVDRMIADAEASEAAQQARVGAVVGAAWLVFLLFPLWMGVRDGSVYAGLVGSLFVVVAMSVVRAAWRDQGSALVVVIALVQAIVMGFATRMFGPFVIVPGIVAATTAMFAFNELRHLRLLVAFGCASILVPYALEKLGVLAPSYAYGPDGFIIRANFVDFPPIATEAALLFSSVGTVLMAALALSRARRGLQDARRRLAVQKWQLEQIVPSAAAESQLAPLVRE